MTKRLKMLAAAAVAFSSFLGDPATLQADETEAPYRLALAHADRG